MWRYALTGLLALSGCNVVFGINGATTKGGGDDTTDGSNGSNGSDSAVTCVNTGCDETGTTPICGDDGSCRACVSNDECTTSNACIPTDSGDAHAGACASVAEVAYVTPTGTTNGTCDQTTPCTLAAALATNRPFIRISGAISETAPNQMSPRFFLGESGASLSGNSPVISTNADLHVYDLDLTGTTATGLGHVVEINDGSAFLERVHVTGGKVGIFSQGTRLTVTRSKIDSNTVGGIDVALGGFDLTNNFIVGNGADGATGGNIGGVKLETQDATSRLLYNTIADNKVGDSAGSGVAGGVTCGSGVAVVLANNILAANLHSGTGPGAHPTNLAGACTEAQNSIDQADFDGLSFADPSQLDYHITATIPPSKAVDKGMTTGGTPVNIDFDGNKRPQNNIPDIGAHELPQ